MSRLPSFDFEKANAYLSGVVSQVRQCVLLSQQAKNSKNPSALSHAYGEACSLEITIPSDYLAKLGYMSRVYTNAAEYEEKLLRQRYFEEVRDKVGEHHNQEEAKMAAFLETNKLREESYRIRSIYETAQNAMDQLKSTKIQNALYMKGITTF